MVSVLVVLQRVHVSAFHRLTRAARLLDDRSAVPHLLAAERAWGLRHGGTASTCRRSGRSPCISATCSVIRAIHAVWSRAQRRYLYRRSRSTFAWMPGMRPTVAFLPCAVAAAVAGLSFGFGQRRASDYRS